MRISFVKHKDCSYRLLTKIGRLKRQHWDYSVASQKKWFNENLSAEDMHLCVHIGSRLIAYTTVINIRYALDDKKWKDAMGIGSVSVDKDHLKKEYGFLVVQLATFYINQSHSAGFLLCRDELISFYSKCNWKLYNGEVNIRNFDRYTNVMSTTEIVSESIMFDKSF